MNKQLTPGPLLDSTGNLADRGFAYELVRDYDRKAIKRLKGRIKEWDYYEFNTEDFGIALTIDDNSYMDLVSVSFLDFKNGSYITKSYIGFFSFGKVNLPSTSKVGDIKFKGKNFDFQFLNDGETRHLICDFKKFTEYSDFHCDLIVKESSKNSLVIATPFAKNRHFYYNQKINNLICNGTASIGERQYELKDALGVLDWGRGIWTYKNTWYWASCSARDKKGNLIGFNMGYGFGDTSAASENIIFYNDKAYKLNDVTFLIPKNDKGEYEYTKPWKFLSESGDINLTFTPILDRKDKTDIGIICSDQHQVFGRYSGEVKVKNKTIKFDEFIGFAERVTNKW